MKKKRFYLIGALVIFFLAALNLGMHNSANAEFFGDKEEVSTGCYINGERVWDCHDCDDGNDSCTDKTCVQCEDASIAPV